MTLLIRKKVSVFQKAIQYFFAIAFIFISINSHAATTLRVAVASNFAPIAKKLIPEFTKNTGITVDVISGASGALFQQIRHGAPYDMFLSADSVRPQALKEYGFITASSLDTYAIGKLAFWSATHPINKGQSISNILSHYSTIAISNPKTAPYGYSAKQALISLALWDKFRAKLITGFNVNQTFQQVRSKSVKGGFVALSQLKLNGLIGLEIPQEHYEPIKQQLVILKRSKKQNAAKKFATFLKDIKTQQLIASFGYTAMMPPTTEN